MKTRIESTEYRGVRAISLSNESLAALVIPSRGGKIASIRLAPDGGPFSGRELLAQPEGSGPLNPARYDSPFTGEEGWGFDDTFPGIDPLPFPYYPWEGIPVPDHGELWSLPFDARMGDDGSVSLETPGIRFPYRFTKTLSLEGSVLLISYRIDNPTPFPFRGIWTAHALFRAEEGARIELPAGTTEILNAVPGLAFPERGGRYGWPRGPDGIDRSRVPPMRGIPNAWQKYYCGSGTGSCGIGYPDGLSVSMDWDAATLPYLGIWLNEGGWNGQYNIGLEPSTGGMDSPEAARAFRMEAEPIPPFGSVGWRLRIAAGLRESRES
jgi:hypothetical protein